MKKTVYIALEQLLLILKEDKGDDLLTQHNSGIGYHDTKKATFIRLEPVEEGIEAYRALSEHYDTYLLWPTSSESVERYSIIQVWIKTYLGEEAMHRLLAEEHLCRYKGSYLIHWRAAKEREAFEGEWMHMGSKRFPSWSVLLNHLIDEKPKEATTDDLAGTTLRLLVTKLMSRGFRARNLNNGTILSIKGQSYRLALLDTITFKVAKSWVFNGTRYYSGEVLDQVFDHKFLQVEGHRYIQRDTVNVDELWGEEPEPSIAKCCVGTGERPSYEFEDYTGCGFYGEESDPVYESTLLPTYSDSYDLLTELWEQLPSCIDALVHIAYLHFDSHIDRRTVFNCLNAARYIAEKDLPKNLDGCFLWLNIDNRPYLRALHGLVLMHWKEGQFDEAKEIACRMLALNPMDNQGIRFIIDDLHNHEAWEPDPSEPYVSY